MGMFSVKNFTVPKNFCGENMKGKYNSRITSDKEVFCQKNEQ